MPSLLEEGAAWLGEQLQGAAGIEVEYGRRSASLTMVGWPSMHEYEVLDEDGIPTRILSQDWTFVAAELVLDDQPIEPRPGDRITQTVDGEEFPFEVMPLEKKPCFERLDAAGRLVVVHTKRVS